MSDGISSQRFLRDYLWSLRERTRLEKGEVKLGLDWVVYNLGIELGWVPIRLPFLRRPAEPAPKAKTEAEFGVDLAFIDQTCNEYIVFVLKDEELTNANWKRHDFDADLDNASRAPAPDLSRDEYSDIKTVRIILAYNKDEDRTGATLFDNLVAAKGARIGGNVALHFDRWNIDRLAAEVSAHLLSPDLLPQHLAASFRYLCYQVGDLEFGGPEWENQLVPQWKIFVDEVLQEPLNEARLRLVPVMMEIIRHHFRDTPASKVGWIDLLEWAMLGLWRVYPDLASADQKQIVVTTWVYLYLAELKAYFKEVEGVLVTQHCLHTSRGRFGLNAVNDAYVAYWHLGRLGILGVGVSGLVNMGTEDGRRLYDRNVRRSASIMTKMSRANPSTLRPLLDVHHVEIYLVWLIMLKAQAHQNLYEWLDDLGSRLLTRRLPNHGQIPFMEGRNQLDLVAEFAATGRKPYGYVDDNSCLLLMVLELCCSLPEEQRDDLLELYSQRVIRVIGEDGEPVCEPIHLTFWIPPADWDRRVFSGSLQDEGIAITLRELPCPEEPLSSHITAFVSETRKQHPPAPCTGIPIAPIMLACIKNKSPLPSEFWRTNIFGPPPDVEEQDGEGG